MNAAKIVFFSYGAWIRLSFKIKSHRNTPIFLRILKLNFYEKIKIKLKNFYIQIEEIMQYENFVI